MPIITNEEKTVTEIAEKILPMCDEVFFEVGYFYFSGFEQIYKQLKVIEFYSTTIIAKPYNRFFR